MTYQIGINVIDGWLAWVCLVAPIVGCIFVVWLLRNDGVDASGRSDVGDGHD